MRAVTERTLCACPRARLTLHIIPALLLLIAVPSQAQDATWRIPDLTPAVVVQIRFLPEGRTPWLDAFETHIAPAVQTAINAGRLRAFSYYEAIVPGQTYDFLLILQADSFAFFDRRQPYPHYVALFEREGIEEGRRIVSRMTGWEADVSVSLVRGFGSPR
jgi:hypothetical protein